MLDDGTASGYDRGVRSIDAATAARSRGRKNQDEEERPMVKVGDVAPDFKRMNHLGKEVSLAGLKGKRVVLWFYPKADTPG